MADDFYVFSAKQRLQQISAEKAQALANLEQSKASADYESAAASVQAIANLEAEKQNLIGLHNQYVASQNPPEQPETTAEERFARPWDRMTWDDALDLARTSQFGKDLTHDDPHVRAGYREVQRRRSRGE